MCQHPQLHRVKGPHYDFVLPVSCGKCYECFLAKKQEWVFRVISEVENETESMSFVTFTYDNEHLPFVGSRSELRTYVEKIMRLPLGSRNWDFSILSTYHIKKLISDIQEWYKNAFRDLMFEKHEVHYSSGNWKTIYKVRPEWKGSHLVRYYASSEYGCLDHRPHTHFLFLFSQILHTIDVENMSRSCWPYGDVFVEDITSLGVADYIAKHQMKVDRGSDYQRSVSPSFKRVSVAYGGLGRCLKDDEQLYRRYCEATENGEYRKRFVNWFDSNGREWVTAMPRFLQTAYRIRLKGYEHRNMTDVELQYLENNLVQRYYDKMYKNYLENPQIFSNFVRKDDESWENFYSRVMWTLSNKKIEEYYLKYYDIHFLKRLQKKNFSTDLNI